MKIVVTGAGGFVGKRLVGQLASQGHKVIALLKRTPLKVEERFFDNELITTLVFDLNNLDVRALPEKADALITLAQSSHFRDFPQMAEDVMSVNVDANVSLLKWAIGAGVSKVVHASSGGVYGGNSGETFSETDLLSLNSPIGFYLGSKLCSEIVFQNFSQFFDSVSGFLIV